MSINSLSGVGNAIQQQSIKSADAKLRAAIASIVSGKRADDVANVAIATQLQSQTSGLKQISSNLAQGTSLTQVADGGAEQIQNALQQLQSIAQQSRSPTLNADNRAQLNEQFQQVVSTIDKLAQGTSFNGQSLLDGSVSGNNSLSLDSFLGNSNSGGNDLSISSLTSGSLLGGSFDVLSADSAGQALSAIAGALNQVTSVRADIGAFQQTLNFAAANVDSALVNQQAAQSSLNDTDLADASTQLSLADIQRNASIALAAQGNRLSPALLQLIG